MTCEVAMVDTSTWMPITNLRNQTVFSFNLLGCVS